MHATCGASAAGPSSAPREDGQRLLVEGELMGCPRGLFRPSYWLEVARRAPELGQYLGYRLGCRRYSDYYAAMMRRKAKTMPARTADDRWAEVGRRQFEFIRTHGLEARHSLLDFGCGSLRTGLHFIEFVQPAHYWGVDISGEALAVGRRLLSERGLEWRRPTLRVVTDLSFDWTDGRTFDFVVA